MLNKKVTITAFNGSVIEFTSDALVGGYEKLVMAKLPSKHTAYISSYSIWESDTACDSIDFEIILLKELVDGNTTVKGFIEFKYWKSARVTLSIYKGTSLVQNDIDIGIIEDLSYVLLGNDVIKVSVSLTNYNAISNTTLTLPTFPIAYGGGYMVNPKYEGFNVGYRYTIGEGDWLTWVDAAFDKGVDISANMTVKGKTYLQLNIKPTGEFRIKTRSYVMQYADGIADNNLYFINFVASAINVVIKYNYTGTAIWYAYKYNPDTNTYSNLISSAAFNFTSGINKTLTIPAINASTYPYVMISFSVAPLDVYMTNELVTNNSHLMLANILYILRKLNCPVKFDFKSICIAHFTLGKDCCIGIKDLKGNAFQIMKDIANSFGAVIIERVGIYRAQYLNYRWTGTIDTTLPTLIHGSFQVKYIRPPYKDHYQIGFDSKHGGAMTDIAASVDLAVNTWFRKNIEYYISGLSSTSAGIAPYACDTLKIDTNIISTKVSGATVTDIGISIPNLVSYKTSHVYEFSFQTLDYNFTPELGKTYKISNLPMTTFVNHICIFTKIDRPIYKEVGTISTITGVLFL